MATVEAAPPGWETSSALQESAPSLRASLLTLCCWVQGGDKPTAQFSLRISLCQRNLQAVNHFEPALKQLSTEFILRTVRFTNPDIYCVYPLFDPVPISMLRRGPANNRAVKMCLLEVICIRAPLLLCLHKGLKHLVKLQYQLLICVCSSAT